MVAQFTRGQEFVSLREAMNQLMEDSFTNFRPIWQASRNGGTAQPLPLDVYATADEVVVIAAAPGMRPEDLEITIHQGTLVLTGKVGNVAEAEEAKGATWYLHELPHGHFRRTITLPFEVDQAQADATVADGIVKLRLPKAEQAKPKRIEIRLTQPTETPAAVTAGTTAEQAS